MKARMPYRVEDRDTLTEEAKVFLRNVLLEQYQATPPALRQITTVRFTRTTLVDFEDGTRPTLDVDLSWTHAGETVHGQGHVLVETKSASRDSTIDRMLRCLGARPIEMSKYTLAIGVFYPAIPANPWHRALRRYVG
jgi:hypothetical protein